MCEFCHTYPHLIGCPNAPEPEPIHTCKYCGESIIAEDRFVEVSGEYYHSDCLEYEMPFDNLMGLFGCRIQIAQEEY